MATGDLADTAFANPFLVCSFANLGRDAEHRWQFECGGFARHGGGARGLAAIVLGGLVVVLALLSNTLSASVTYGPQHTLFWLTPLTAAGLGLGWLSALLMVRLPSMVLMRTMLLIQTAVLCVVNLVPSSTYFAQTVQTWEQGKFIRFHGLTEWLSWGWPFALMVWGVMHLLSNSTRAEAT